MNDNCFRRTASAALLAVVIVYAASTLLCGERAYANDLAEMQNFNIRASSLDRALLEFGRQAHVQLAFKSTNDLRAARPTELKGRYSGRKALASLLRGSGLTYSVRDDTVTLVSAESGAPGSPPANGAAKPRSSREAVRLSKQPPEKVHPGSTSLQEITVTGTHILGVVPIAPITTITAEDVKATGLPDIASVIRALPQFYSGGQNVGAIVGGGINAGEPFSEPATANLRGIGSGATLTLLDGHRLAGNGPGGFVDLSAIPTAAVERVDVDTSGASAIYGADAVAGVVNVILKKNYDGEETDAYVGGTESGGLTQRYSQIIGRTNRNGSAGVMVGYQFQSLDEVLANQREVSRGAGATTALQPQDKSHALFVSAHYAPSHFLEGHMEGVYNHRTSRDLWDIGDYQTLDDQFSLDGGFRVNCGCDQTVDFDVIWAGDSSSNLAYAPSLKIFQPVDRFATQDRRLALDVAGQGEMIRIGRGRVIRWAAGAGVANSLLDEHFATGTGSPVSASRRQEHAYLELNVPIVSDAERQVGLDRLTFNAAGRFEHSSDFGSIAVPKMDIAYSPVGALTLSGSWGKSYQSPALYQLDDGRELVRDPGSFFLGVPPDREVLVLTGSNPLLRPQTATSRVLSVEWRPETHVLRGFDARVSYYDTEFSGRIATPIADFGEAVSNPLYSPFVVLNPSAAVQAQARDSAATYLNYFGLPSSPSDVAALVNDTNQNLSKQVIHGVDATIDWQRSTGIGDFMVTAVGELVAIRSAGHRWWWSRADRRDNLQSAKVQISAEFRLDEPDVGDAADRKPHFRGAEYRDEAGVMGGLVDYCRGPGRISNKPARS